MEIADLRPNENSTPCCHNNSAWCMKTFIFSIRLILIQDSRFVFPSCHILVSNMSSNIYCPHFRLINFLKFTFRSVQQLYRSLRQLVGSPLFGGHIFCPRRLKFSMEAKCVSVCVYASWLKGSVVMGVAFCKKVHFLNGFIDLHKIQWNG